MRFAICSRLIWFRSAGVRAYKVSVPVSVSGEVLFSGSYALLKKNERLSDLIKRAGGITPDAFT